VTGQSAAAELELPHATQVGGLVKVVGGAVLVDGRVPSSSSPALAKLQERAGPAAREVQAQAEVFGALFRVELQSLAGSELQPSVTALAQMAINAMATLYRAELLAGAAFGDWSEAYLDHKASTALNERADKSQRNMAGLAIVARDLLLAARAAAKEARTAAGNPVDDLSARLAAGEAQREVLPQVPVDPPGVVSSGAPSPSIPPPSGEPK
jgi:hypothetical protein